MPGGRDWIEPVAAERMTAAEPPRTEPPAAEQAVARDRFSGVIGTRRHKPARAGEPRRNQRLIQADETKGEPGREAWARAMAIGHRVPRGRQIRAREWGMTHREIRGVG